MLDAYLALLQVLVSANVLQPRDLDLGQLWVRDLSTMGYAWPSVSTPQGKRDHAPAPIIDERRHEMPVSTTANDRTGSDDRASRAGRGRPLPAGPTSHVEGRTAICVTGFPRSLFASFPDELTDKRGQFTESMAPSSFPRKDKHNVEHWRHNGTWAGEPDGSPEAAAHPDWYVAQSIRNNVLNVLSNHGGYDLFIIEPGNSHDSKWDILTPRMKSSGAPDGLFMSQGGAEPDLWYNKSDPRWRSWFYAQRYGLNHAHVLIEQFLYQLKHLQVCNDEVRKHEADTGMKYTYKMRLRPDFAWAAPIPPLNVLRDQITSKRLILMSNKFWPGYAYLDCFAFGEASAMDRYLDRLPHIHTFERRRDLWAAEQFVVDYMAEQGIELVSHDEFLSFPVFERKGARGNSERAPFLSANGGHTDMVAPPLPE